jgi:hypothetical protein
MQNKLAVVAAVHWPESIDAVGRLMGMRDRGWLDHDCGSRCGCC